MTQVFFFFNDTATTEIYTLSLHDALPISTQRRAGEGVGMVGAAVVADEEALVEVRPGRLVNRRVPLHALVHRQVADVVLVDLERELFLQGDRVELARGVEGGVDERLRHRVAGQ